MDAIKASVLEKLIRELCPEGVEYRELSELFKTKNGYTPSKGNKEFWENGNIPWFRMDDIRQNGGILSRALQNVTEKAVKGEVFPENSLIVATSATIGEHALITVPSLANQRFTYLLLKEEYKNKFEMRFLYYYCFKLDEYCKSNLNQGNFASVDMGKFSKFKFPLPPLPIQQEIVRILDTFTNFTAELTDKLNAELTARRKQYEYYRDELLKTGEQVSLYEVAQYSKDRILASELTDENYVGVDNLLPNKQGKIKSEHTPIEGKFTGFVKGDILIGNIRPYLKKIWFSDCVGGTNGDVLTIRVIDKERVLPRFLYFALSTESFFNYDMNNAKGAKMPRGDKKAVMNYQFYLPSLEIQEKVVSILETFDNLCNGFEYGLPAEIYARQQQYEYYRDELLNFKELHNKED